MANPNALLLLADHIKLSLLERQRTKSLDLLQDDAATATPGNTSNSNSAADDAQDGHISRSLDQLRDGLDALKREQARLEAEGEEGRALDIADALPSLQMKLNALTAQFSFHAGGSATEGSPSTVSPSPANNSKPAKKAVRFNEAGNADDDAEEAARRAGLFNRPYTDDPEEDDDAAADALADHDNVQLHQMHSRILSDQDAQLDALGASISRQRELSMQIGDELDNHVALLEEGERLTDRHQTRIDRARRQVNKISRSAGDCKQMVAIVVLILILVLLIIILK